MNVLLPSMQGQSKSRSSMAWLASTSVTALLVSGIAALAMTMPRDEPGKSLGDIEEPMMVMMMPSDAMTAMTEPTPDVVDSAPSQQADGEVTEEEIPDTPELASDMPETTDAPVIEEALADAAPEMDMDLPEPPVVEKPEVALEKPKPKKEVAEKKPEPKKPVKKTTEKKEPAKEPAKKKAAENSASAKASKSAQGAASSGGGSAASAAKYGALVEKKISRTKKRSIREKGVATVRFSIAPSGAIASISIARGSGSAAVDTAAMDHIRRAAPFPPPPAGAKTSFNFNVKYD